jgi:hypothetical protein
MKHWLGFVGLAAQCALGTLAVAASGSAGDARLGGHWQLERSASDDFDAKLATYAREARAKWRPPGGRRQSERDHVVEPLPDELPPETADEMRDRMGETLRPAEHLQIEVHDHEVQIVADKGPTRNFTPGETVLRMDTSGTAEVSTVWSGTVLTVRSKYMERARRVQQYSMDKNGELLHVTLQINDQMSGKLELKSTYRRVRDQGITAQRP